MNEGFSTELRRRGLTEAIELPVGRIRTGGSTLKGLKDFVSKMR